MTPDPHSVRSRADERWTDLEIRMAAVLEALPEGDFMIVSCSEDAAVPDAYVQFGATGTGLYCEAVSNVYLPEGSGLSESDEARLRRYGWEEPGDSGNWRTELSGPNCFEVAARLAVRTLRGVHGQDDPRWLSVSPSGLAESLEVLPHVEEPDEEDELDQAQHVAVIADQFGHYVGRTAEGVHSVVIDDEYCRMMVDELDGLRFATMCVLLGCGVEASAENLSAVARMASQAGDYRIESRPGPDGESALWLTTSLALDPDDDSLKGAFTECWQLAEASRWATAALEAGCSHG